NKLTEAEAAKKQAQRTKSLPPGFFLSPYQEKKKRPHPATLPARKLEDHFDPKEAALKLLKTLDKAQQAAVEMYQATKAAYLNARDYDETKLSMKYLDQAISSFKIITDFLPWKVAISQYSDNWNPYKERTNLRVLRNNQEPRKAKSESSSKFNNYKIPKNKALGSKPYEKPNNKKKNSNKWKETFRMARVLMEVKDAIEE
ncbi:hypothetical protein PTTG_06522, partial [Puccinia triticina 1-1 BBBD Race 1]